MKKSIVERDKPRKIYVNEQVWRDIKAECAKEGISISKWFREQAKNKTIFLKVFAIPLLLIGAASISYLILFSIFYWQ